MLKGPLWRTLLSASRGLVQRAPEGRLHHKMLLCCAPGTSTALQTNHSRESSFKGNYTPIPLMTTD